ncbi:MAG: hypothetical protein HY390_06245 [Deltaproteobacteria bacterium]|nr:hypothetical protein [Deltaproteobacteria bacterium]
MFKKLHPVAIFYFCTVSVAFSYTYEHQELRSLPGLIATSLESQRQPQHDLKIDPILKLYQHFDRSQLSAQDFIELKFQLSHWKKMTKEYLLKKISEITEDDKELFVYLSALQKLKVKLSPYEIRAIGQHPFLKSITLRPLFSDLLSQQGSLKEWKEEFDPAFLKSLLPQAGPQEDIAIFPIHASKWSFKKWGALAEFSHYAFKGDELHYRGLTLRAGDFLVANLTHKGDGVYTMLFDPRCSFSHFAYVAFLEQDGKKYPAAIEIYEFGVRAVPLSTFLSPYFSPYLEVYRLKSVPKNWAAAINQKAKEMIQEVHAYNFYFEEDNEKYLSCTTVGTCALRRTGVLPLKANGILQGNIGENVKKLGVQNLKALSPMDYVISDRVQFIGTIDNNQFSSEVHKELVLRRIRHLFEIKTLAFEKFPFRYRINRWGIEKINNRSIIGSLFMWAEGFRAETFPRGPIDGMAMVEILEAETAKAVEHARSIINPLIDPDFPFSIHTLEENKDLQSEIDQTLPTIAQWFY